MRHLKSLIYSIPLFLVIFTWQGCDSVILNDNSLDKRPNGFTEESYFNTESEFESGIFGIYAKMSDKYWFNNNDPIHGLWHLPGDDITSQRDNDFETFGPLDPENGHVQKYWTALYQVINRANIMFEKLDNEDGIYETANLKDYHRGEALFLRAWANIEIWNYWGAHAPLRLEVIREANNVNSPSSNTDDPWGTELLDQAIADLRDAADLLPPAWDDENLGRANTNSANGLLGKTLLFRATITGNGSDYGDAISAFESIQGVSLAENYGDNFSSLDLNNEESLFEYQAAGAPVEDNVWLSNDFDIPIGSFSAYWGFYANHWSEFEQQPFIPTQKLADAYDGGDPRADYTLGPDSDPVADRDQFIKYVRDEIRTDTGVGSTNNPRILRYADVLLLHAEALVESGGSTSDAIDLINQVRERARNSATPVSAEPADRSVAETDRDVIFDWIMEERFLELAGEEGHRWWDLRRWHKAGKIDLSQWDFGSVRTVNIDLPKHLFLPIPQEELDANANIVQNEGY